MKIVVLASGNGTALQAIFEEINAGTLPGIEVKKVISDVKDSGALEKARAQGVIGMYLDPAGLSREKYGELLSHAIGEGIDTICLIGFMRILSPQFIQRHAGKILNVHPSLLPKFGGKGWYGNKVHEGVLEAGERESGMTIHFVTEEVDAGPILLQKKVEISAEETPTSLKAKVQALECQAYPEALRDLKNR